MDFAQATDEAGPRREKAPRFPLVEPGEARSSGDAFERRYLAAVLSASETLDGFPLDLEAAIGSDPIRALLGAVAALRRDGKGTSREHVERYVREHVDEPTRTAALLVASDPLDFADDLDPVVVHLRQRGAMRRMRQQARTLLDACERGRFGVAQSVVEKRHDITGDAAPEDARASLSESMRMALPREALPGQPLEALSPVLRFDPQLDGKIRLRRGEFLALGLATNVGKSTVIEDWSRGALAHGHGVLTVSVEDTVELFGRKSLSALAGIDRDALADGAITKAQRENAEREIAKIAEAERAGIVRHSTVRVRNRSVVGVCQWIRRAGAEGLAIVMVDYLQAIMPDRRFHQRKDAIDYCLNAILAAAASANVALITSSQFARREKNVADMKRPPVLADFKESGDIENCATYAVCGWRKRTDARAPIFGTILKNKSGGYLGPIDGWQRDELGILRRREIEASARDDDDGGAADEGGF